jgi:dipeptidyl aminopeptidase/acylaminoacyl peptidase
MNKFIIVVLALAACAGGKDTADSAADTDTVQTWPPPVVAIGSPTDGELVTGPDVEVVVDLEGFSLDITAGTARSAPSLAPTLLVLLSESAWAHELGEPPGGVVVWTLDGDEVARTATDRYTFTALAAGEHEVEVELVYSDGDAFYPAVIDDVSFTVQ